MSLQYTICCWVRHPTPPPRETLENALSHEEPDPYDVPEKVYELGLSKYWSTNSPDPGKKLRECHELFHRAVDLGVPEANFYLHHRKLCPQNDGGKAAEYTRAAQNGSVAGMLALAGYHANGKCVPFDLGRTFELTQRAADTGNAYAIFELALLYDEGKGVAVNHLRARELWSESAHRGCAIAMETIGRMHLVGSFVPKDKNKAAYLFQKVADMHTYPPGLTSLATCYQKGLGVSRDPRHSLRLLQLASDSGNLDATSLKHSHFFRNPAGTHHYFT